MAQSAVGPDTRNRQNHDEIAHERLIVQAIDLDRHGFQIVQEILNKWHRGQHRLMRGAVVAFQTRHAARVKAHADIHRVEGTDVDIVRTHGHRPQHRVHVNVEVERSAIFKHPFQRAMALLKGTRT